MEPKSIVVMVRETQYVFVYAGELAPGVERWEGVVNDYPMIVMYDQPADYGIISYTHGLGITKNTFSVQGYAELHYRVKECIADIVGLSDYEKFRHMLSVTFDVIATDLRVCDAAIWVYVCRDSGEWFYTNYWNTDNTDGTYWESALFPPDVIPSTEHALQQIITGAI